MPVTVEIIPIPIGSQFVETISGDEPESLNDFKVRILTSENGTGLQESDITFSTGASLVELTGDGVTREAVIRPPETAGTVTITIAADAFTEGNVETEKDIRISTSFPDVDAETPTELTSSGTIGIAVSPTRIYVISTTLPRVLLALNHSGAEQTSEELSINSNHVGTLDYFNGDLIANGLYRFSPQDDTRILTYPQRISAGAVHTRLGKLEFDGTRSFWVLPYGTLDSTDFYEIETEMPFPFAIGSNDRIAHQNNLLYLHFGTSSTGFTGLARIRDDGGIEFVKLLNVKMVKGPAIQSLILLSIGTHFM